MGKMVLNSTTGEVSTTAAERVRPLREPAPGTGKACQGSEGATRGRAGQAAGAAGCAGRPLPG